MSAYEDERERRRRRRKKERKQARKAAESAKTSPPLAWAQKGVPPEEWTEAELYTFLVNPAPTGLGVYPRTVSDEDWVDRTLKFMEEYGEAQVVRDIIDVLRATEHYWNDETKRGGKAVGYPPPKTSRKLPMTLCDVGGPHDESTKKGDGKWNGNMVRSVLLNPVFCGISHFQRTVEDDMWIKVVLRTAKEEGGMVQVLVDILFLLRLVYGFPGNDTMHVPLGYREDGSIC